MREMRIESAESFETYRSKEQLEIELADAELLHRLSIELIQEDGMAGLYKKIVEAAVTIMRSQFGTIQMLYPVPGTIGKLKLLAAYGFSPEAEKYWEWVHPHTLSSCGQVLRTGKQVVIPDYENVDFMQGAETLQIFLDGGIHAAQSTPLYSRTGKLLGMISTHWQYTYTPPERHLRLLDILARQAADLIERINASEALRESEERMRALTAATTEVIYRMSHDWNTMYNLDGRNLLSHTGQPISDWKQKYIHPLDIEIVNQAIKEAICTESVFQLEYRVFRVDGTVGWVFSRAVPIKDSDNKLIEWFGTASDITQKKSFVSELENKVAERTLELQRSNEDLQQFAHVASHDLKEPVRKIKTFGLRLQEELNGHASVESRNFMEKILNSASRMSTMIEGVLTYSTMNAANEKIELLDLNKIISDIENDLEVLIDQKKAIIKHNDLPQFEGAQVLIYQLFYNLINNSIKFSKESENVIVDISRSISSDEEGEFTTITVSDNGIGFESEHNESIFNTFTRLNPKFKYDGTGLGLSLAKKIIERHHGSIKALGSINVGSVFTIRIPLKQPMTS